MRKLTSLLVLAVVLMVPVATHAGPANLNCGRVTLSGAPGAYRVYMRTRYMKCATAIRVASETLFGQSTTPAGGFSCKVVSSERGQCRKGVHGFSYALYRSYVRDP